MSLPGPAGWPSTAEVSSAPIPPFPQGKNLLTVSPSLVVVIFGPAAATWFKFLQNRVNLRSANATILARVACDQGIFAPVFIGVFLSSMAVLEGGSPKEKLEKNYSTALSTNYLLWPFVQLVNFKLVPLHHRLLFVNVISIGWNSYLSYLNSRKA